MSTTPINRPELPGDIALVCAAIRREARLARLLENYGGAAEGIRDAMRAGGVKLTDEEAAALQRQLESGAVFARDVGPTGRVLGRLT